ncbi:MAG: hypothetical protein E7300_03715 [Lachnospiraceae bacterium]|nr:hypothetical protein [Lachnospiraceae bacterium]
MKTLIVAEKPMAGKDIAKVVGANKNHGDYMEGDNYVVTWAVGHLIGLKTPNEHDEKYGEWSTEQLPISFPLGKSLKVLPKTMKQFKVIKDLIHRDDIDLLINAGDAGREGYLIQEWIYRMAGCKLPKKVLWASSLTTAGIKQALDNLKDNETEEFKGILREAEARAEGDYFLGMNYSRLLTCTRAYKQTLSYGRCQTPLLNLIAKRDAEIAAFKSTPYWTLNVTYKKGFKGILVGDDDKEIRFTDKIDADEWIKRLDGKSGVVIKYQKEDKREKAPLLYNLAKLQQDMGRKYKLSPDETLQIVQDLYEKHKMCSYPRTDSQYLSMDIYDEIVEHLKSCSFGLFKGLIDGIDFDGISADKSYFNDLKVTDHHALIPTINEKMESEYEKLDTNHKNVFDAIALSLIAIFYPDYRYESTTIVTEIAGGHFKSSGTTIKALGYKSILREQKDDLQILPELKEGNSLSLEGAQVLSKKTEPPKKYNDSSIVKVMEKYNIGTSATRAEIIKKLQSPERRFIVREKGKYSVTSLGKEYIAIIPDELKAPELTQQFEESLVKVNEGDLSKDDFLSELLNDFNKNLQKFTSEELPDEKKIGFSHDKAKQSESLGKCPKCGGDVKMGKFGAWCTQKCGMFCGKAFGTTLTAEQVRKLLAGESIKIKCKGEDGKMKTIGPVILDDPGFESIVYIDKKSGKEVTGYRYVLKRE